MEGTGEKHFVKIVIRHKSIFLTNDTFDELLFDEMPNSRKGHSLFIINNF